MSILPWFSCSISNDVALFVSSLAFFPFPRVVLDFNIESDINHLCFSATWGLVSLGYCSSDLDLIWRDYGLGL